MGYKVKIFDEEHEEDLEIVVNSFLRKLDSHSELIDIKYQVAVSNNEEDQQIYCFSAMIVYQT